jgi:ubiquinone/menaquinone biosynthesis C-methylase UbiE
MALKGAIDLELFTHIAAGAATVEEIAERCRANERGVRILCDFLSVIGFLNKTDGRYGLAPDSAIFLDKKSPAYLGSVTGFLTSPAMLGAFGDVGEVVRKGGPLDGSGNMLPENDIWVTFATSMWPMAAMAARKAAPLIAEPGRQIKVLDIAAGHGYMGIGVAQSNPEAEIVAADWKNVLEVALENAARAGVGDRFRTVPGDVFETELGSGYDLVTVSNFFHCFDAQTNIRLLKKVHAAMKPGGRLATIDFVPNEDRVSPPAAAAFAINMLNCTESGDVYTFREFDAMFRAAGFGESRMQALEPLPVALLVSMRSN